MSALGKRRALAAAVACALAGCGADDNDDPPAGPSPFLELGAVLSLSGSGRDVGVAEQAGIRAAERHINALGGVLGRPIRVTVIDDNSDPNLTRGTMLDLLGRTLPIVLGPTGSDGAAAIADVVAERRAVVISSSATGLGSGAQAGGDNFFFRLTPSDAVQSRALRQFALSQVRVGDKNLERCPTAAVVFSDDLYGQPIATQFGAYFQQSSRVVALNQPVSTYLQPDNSYLDVARAVASSDADCQLIVTKPDVSAAYLRAFDQVKREGARDWTNFLTVGGDALHSQTFLVNSRQNPSEPNSPSVAEGVYIVAPDATQSGPAYNAFRQVYQAQRPGETPPPFSANAFDAVVLAALAIEQAKGDLGAPALRDSLLRLSSAARTYDAGSLLEAIQDLRRGLRINYATASGTTGVGANGEVVSDFIVSPVVNGQFQDPPLTRFSASELQ